MDDSVPGPSDPAIPVIDFSPVIASDAEGTRHVVAAVERACTTIGFFLVTGHGVDPEATRALYDGARALFDAPEAVKAALASGAPHRGGLAYARLEAEALAATLGLKTPGDYKESLNFGPNLEGADWPVQPPGLQQAFLGYFGQMETLAKRLRGVFCSAIGLPPDHFESAFDNHLSALRVINYPEQPAEIPPGQMRAGVHTDYGFLTILRSEASSGGLQVQSRSGQWIDAPSVEGAFVINIGDAFMRWTNDRWRSTPHRVANAPPGQRRGSRRQSIPFFLNPSAETMIACLEPFQDGGAKYAPIGYADYIALKTRQAYAG